MNLAGVAIDWIEALSNAMDDPEARPAGSSEPQYAVSRDVTVSRDHSLYVYHTPDDVLGQGSSLGNVMAWAETKGNGDMLNFFSIELGRKVMGGLSITYMLPFSDLSSYGTPVSSLVESHYDKFTRAMPSSVGYIHLHPAYQQREFVIGDGVHILETFFVPRTDDDNVAAAYEIVHVENKTPHPIGLTIVASLGLRGWTDRDMVASYDESRNTLLAWNESNPEWVRVFGSPDSPKRYWATCDQEEAYNPGQPLPDKTDEKGDLTGALQFEVMLEPGQSGKVRVVLAFSPHGKRDAQKSYDKAVGHHNALKETIQHYASILNTSVVELPDDLLTHGIQWAKACLLRPICQYKVGISFTNDPGNSSNIVGRDTAWYVHGCDFVLPEVSCSMLSILAEHQREDGLIREYINGLDGQFEDFGFNINDNTPLFISAVGHHIKATGHWHCLQKLYGHAKRAGELILSQLNKQGLVECTATGLGPQAICGWRNVLQNAEISGVVTEVNSECYAALKALADMADTLGLRNDAEHYRHEAGELRNLINEHLINKKNGLYVLNIDVNGNVYTQATSDMVFPLMSGVADADTSQVVSSRLSESDFMTDAGIRVLPSENPHYDPSFESGCLGGVWSGATWWYSMGSGMADPKMMADSLKRAYSHYVSDPKVYNTVPGQFSEWFDGQTLVNRGMRLSPWDSPRFLWAAIEGLAGIKMEMGRVSLNPKLPPDWLWLRTTNVLFRDGKLGFFLTREEDGMHVYTSNSFETNLHQHHYDEEMHQGAETITSGISSAVFRKGNEVLICLGSSLDMPSIGPFLAHHSIDIHKHYHTSRLTSHRDGWEDIGEIKGTMLQRIAVRLERRGYALYRFIMQ